jgi:hypothetical protein
MPPYSTQERASQRWSRGLDGALDPGEQAIARIKRHKENRALMEEQEIADHFGSGAGARRWLLRRWSPGERRRGRTLSS